MPILNVRDDTPRSAEELMLLTRSMLYLIGMNMGIFQGTDDEQAFLTTAQTEQVQRVRKELLRRDAEGWPDQGQPLPPVPVMPEPRAQQQQPQQESSMQPPTFNPVIPQTVGQQQQQQQQPQMGMQQQMPMGPPMMPGGMQQGMPPFPPPQGMPMGGMPPFPMQQPQQQQQQPPQPQMQQPQMATNLPQMAAPQWQMPGQPQPQQQPQPAPSGRTPPAPQAAASPTPAGLVEALTKIAEVQVANQKMLEAIHKRELVNTALLMKVLGIQITTAECNGMPQASFAGAVASVGTEDHVKNFLGACGGDPTQGKA
jgi:hypothetical protein